MSLKNWLTVQENHSPYVFSIPHSGLALTDEVLSELMPESTLALPNMDWHLNELYSFLRDAKVNLVSTGMSRYLVDLNRAPESNLFGDYRNSLVYDSNTWGQDIYRKFPTRQALARRVEDFYVPYHRALDQLVENALNSFGWCHVFDLHSFMVPIQCDICLGNVDGKASSDRLIDKVAAALCNQGFRVATNRIFKGGYITQKYIDRENVESIQIELRYTQYVDNNHYESTQCPPIDPKKFNTTKAKLRQAFMDIGCL